MKAGRIGYQQRGPTKQLGPASIPRRFDIVEPVEVDDEVESTDSIDELSETSLPILATGNDIREVVRFLKNKPVGVTTIEAMNAEPRRVFDARKIAAYEFWGIVERSRERLRLSDLGKKLAETIRPECDIHRRILRSIPTYFGALRAFQDQKLQIITRIEAANYWKDSHPELNLSHQDEKNIEAIAVSFFSICHAAELGTLTVGKRGQPARLRIDQDELGTFFESRDHPNNTLPLPWSKQRIIHPASVANPDASNGYVYLATGKGSSTTNGAGHVLTALALADLDDIVYGQTDSRGDFMPQSELAAIRQCHAAIFMLDAGDCNSNKNGELELCGIRLAEINVAIALLNQRVAVLWENGSGLPPESLKQTNLHLFDGENFDWESGVRLVKLLKNLHN